MSPAAPSAQSQRGFTLIELVVVIALLGLLMLVAVPSLRAVFGVDLRTASHEMAETLRYTYQESVIQNMPMRIAYDLDHNTWWVEAADGPARIFRNRKEADAFADFLAEKAESDERVRDEAESRKGQEMSQDQLLAALLGEQAANNPALAEAGAGLLGSLLGGAGLSPQARGGEYKVNQFSPMGENGALDDGVFERRELPREVRFVGAWTPQHDEIVEPMDEFEVEAMLRNPPEEQKWRVVYTHIFPGGYMEDTVVYLGNEDGDDVMSLSVEPLLGLVHVTKGRAELPDLRERWANR